MGKLTYAANSYLLPDGTKVRDSSAVKSFRKADRKAPKAKPRVVKVEGPCKIRAASHGWSMPRSRRTSRAMASASPLKATSAKRTQDAASAKQEAAFQEWWLESRSHVLKPRCEHAPSAKERVDALRARVAARGGAAS